MKIRRSFLAMGLVASIACLPLLGTSGAILSPMAGTVAVNGLPVTAGSAIVAGDLVSTSNAGSARMVLPGGSVIAASNTNFRMVSVNNANQIRLNSGLVKVTGLLPVAVSTRTIVPATASTSFNVYDLSGKVYVEATAGSVAVKAANSSFTVHTGEAVSFSDTQAPAAASASTGSASLAVPVAIGIAAGAAVVTGIVVHQVTKCDNCVSSPSQL
jgi:ferric-dicitrate binding protein FerR (iron transport regulator)